MRALVVEDERRLAAGLRRGLEADGFAVDTALNGLDGLWLARENPYDVIVLDIMLPGPNGFEICATLRDEAVWTPIIVLTARDADRDQVQALDTGADDYLTKPFSYSVLLAHIRALLRRGAAARPAVLEALLEAGRLSIDPATRRAWCDSVELQLTTRELSLLEFFVRRRGQALSKRVILEHVWDYDFEGDPNIVEVYVARLRAKIGRHSIETLRGAGYRLVARP